jgi:hypothetical protein
VNGSDQDFERRLKETFTSHAGDAPRVNLTDGALRRAGKIRTRRRIAAGSVAAAIVAVAVPVGVQLADPPGDERPIATGRTDDGLPAPTKLIDVGLVGLGTGEAPKVPYVSNRTFTKDGVSTPITAASGVISDVVAVEDGLLVWSQPNPDDPTDIEYAAQGDDVALPHGESASNPAYDASTGQAAWAVRGVDGDGQEVDGDTILVAKSVTSLVGSASVGKLKVAHVLGVLHGKVVFNARDESTDTSVVGLVDVLSATPTVEQPWAGVTSVTAIDPDFTRLAAVINGEKGCSTMLGYDDAAEQWSSCTWLPVEFSADGTRVLGLGIGDGLGPNQLAVLDSESGALIQKFTTSGIFGRMTFEDNDTIVGVVAVGSQVAIVRCSVGGDCEKATAAADVEPDEPDSVLTPYQLTAN